MRGVRLEAAYHLRLRLRGAAPARKHIIRNYETSVDNEEVDTPARSENPAPNALYAPRAPEHLRCVDSQTQTLLGGETDRLRNMIAQASTLSNQGVTMWDRTTTPLREVLDVANFRWAAQGCVFGDGAPRKAESSHQTDRKIIRVDRGAVVHLNFSLTLSYAN